MLKKKEGSRGADGGRPTGTALTREGGRDKASEQEL